MFNLRVLNKIKQRISLAFYANKSLFYLCIFITFLFSVLLVEVMLSDFSFSAFFTRHNDLILISTLGLICGLYWAKLIRGSRSNDRSKTIGSNQPDYLVHQKDDLTNQYNTRLTTPSQESILQSHYRGIIFNKGISNVKTYLIPQDSDYSPTYLPNVQEKVHSETDRQIDLKVLKRTSSHNVSFKQPILQTNPLQYNQFSFLFTHNHLSLN